MLGGQIPTKMIAGLSRNPLKPLWGALKTYHMQKTIPEIPKMGDTVLSPFDADKTLKIVDDANSILAATPPQSQSAEVS